MKEKLYTVYSYLQRFVVITASDKSGNITKAVFKPAENVITESDFNKIKEVPMFKEQVELGNFDVPEDCGEVIQIGKPEDKGFKASALKQLSVTKLKETIVGKGKKEGILDIELLYRLKEIEDRKVIIDAIEKQFEKLGVKA